MSLLIEDVQAHIFTQYLKLIQEALEEVNVPELENFWYTSYKLGARGLVMRTTIDKENSFQQLLTAYYKKKIFATMKERNFLEIEEILEKRKEVAFAFVLGVMACYGNFYSKSEETLSIQELANFLYLSMKAITFIPQRGVELTRNVLNMIVRASSLVGLSGTTDQNLTIVSSESKEVLHLLAEKMTKGNWNKQAFRDILLVVSKDKHRENKLYVFHFLVNALLAASQD